MIGVILLRLYTVFFQGESLPAVEKQDRLFLFRDLNLQATCLLSLIRNPSADVDRLRAFLTDPKPASVPSLAKDDVQILAPIPYPDQDVVCIGLNYREHMDETRHVEDFTKKEATVYFSKHAARVSGPSDTIPFYSFVDSLDYEVELGVIVGRDLLGYRAGRDPDPVFGYTVFNDVSARNLQFKHKQWFLGKSLDGYTVMGPCIVTADEIGDVNHLDIACRVNGEVRQHSNTRLLISRIPEVLEELSMGMTVRAGTIIATGTPGGVALGMENPKYLQIGDTVSCEIEGIGILENTVAAV